MPFEILYENEKLLDGGSIDYFVLLVSYWKCSSRRDRRAARLWFVLD